MLSIIYDMHTRCSFFCMLFPNVMAAWRAEAPSLPNICGQNYSSRHVWTSARQRDTQQPRHAARRKVSAGQAIGEGELQLQAHPDHSALRMLIHERLFEALCIVEDPRKHTLVGYFRQMAHAVVAAALPEL